MRRHLPLALTVAAPRPGARWRRAEVAIAAGLALASGAVGLSRAEDTPAPIASAIGEAYRYALPIYEISRLRRQLETGTSHLAPNTFLHSRDLAGPNDRMVTGPNTDTLYSTAILDLSGGPVRIDVPDTHDRYYSIMLVDAYTNDFAFIGRRTTGTHAGSYLVVGPGGKADVKSGLPIIKAPTATVVLILRVLVYGPQDMETAHHLQDGFRLASLGTPPKPDNLVAPVPDNGEAFVAVINQAMTENPPPPADDPMLERIGKVGVGPHAVPLTPELRRAWDDDFPAAQRGLRNAVVNRRQLAASGRQNLINGWSYKARDVGNFGTNYDLRAAVALAGLFSAVPAENLSVAAYTDNTGEPLDDTHRYRLRLPAKMPVDAFWSLSIHGVQPDGRGFFVDNPIHRYAIGDRTPGLKRNADGSLDILIQRDPPKGDLVANWLPMPAGPFRLTLRNYQPRPELLNGAYRYPAVERVD